MSESLQQYGKVAVVMGGWSAEREISLRSGAEVFKALQSLGIDVHAVDVVDADLAAVSQLKREKFDHVFLILHGRGGEDGHIQGALELAGIPYTGSDVLGSALAMDKIRSKQICRQLGIRTADWMPVQSVEQALEAGEHLGYPIIVKPVREGSSLGVTKATHNGVADAFELARQYGDVMMERFIDGMEVTAAVLDGQALPLVSMATPNLFYDYDAKYFSEHTQYKCPVDLPDEQQQRIRETALAAFDAIGARDWGRVDFMVDRQGNEYFMELNTAPGMTDHSLVPMAAAAVDIGFAELCQKVLRLCVHRSRNSSQINSSGSVDADAQTIGEVC